MGNNASGGLGVIGQKTSAQSIPVVFSNDFTLPVEIDTQGGTTDAAGRIRTAEPITVWDHFFTQNDGSLFWDTSLTGSATIAKDSNENAMNLTCTTTSGDKAIHQTKPYFPHQAGKAHQILMTGVMGAIKANVSQRIGYFDDNNGLFFEQDGTNLQVVRRSNTSGSAVDDAVAQSSWNLDPLDGTGDSEVTIDTSAMQLFVIDFEWLGAGRVRLGCVIGGETIYIHEYATANVLTVAFMNVPTLPIRYEIENTGTAASGTTLKQVCATVVSEGGWNPLGLVRSVDTGGSTRNISGAAPVISIRLKSTNNRAVVMPIGISGAVTNGKDIVWRLRHGTTLTSASWSDVSTSAFTQVDVAAASSSGGEVIAGGVASADQAIFSFDISSSLWVASDIAGTSDILTLELERVGAGIATVMAAINYKEFL